MLVMRLQLYDPGMYSVLKKAHGAWFVLADPELPKMEMMLARNLKTKLDKAWGSEEQIKDLRQQG